MQARPFEKQKAIMLRKQGWSLSEISTHLGIAKSSASLWLSDVRLSETARQNIEKKRGEARIRAAQTNKLRVDRKFADAKRYGKDVVNRANLNPDAARLLCAIMYWCEGTKIKRGEVVSFTNSDPSVVATFLRLLREGFSVNENKLRLSLHLHDYHDAEGQLQFWSKVTSIPLTQCYRPYRKPHTGIRTRDGYQGCASVRYLDVDFGRRLESIAQAFLKGPIV